MKTLVYGITPAYAAGGLLAHGMRKLDPESEAFFWTPDEEGYGKYCPFATYQENNIGWAIKRADVVVFCGAKSLMGAVDNFGASGDILRDRKVAVLLTDTAYCNYYKDWNNRIKQMEVTAFAMPDLFFHSSELNPVCYYPPTVCLPRFEPRGRQHGPTVICHSPGSKLKGNSKGSTQIQQAIDKLSKKYDIEYQVLTDADRNESISAKAVADIFIDQLVYKNDKVPQVWGPKHYNGALAKSGCEAMGMGTMTLTGARQVDVRGIASPPHCFTDGDKFEVDLEFLIANRDDRERMAKEQYNWAKAYLPDDTMARHILRYTK